ncbi:hypothetical protein ACFLYU_02665, partial [Candidatus Dependentiae bacterium]
FVMCKCKTIFTNILFFVLFFACAKKAFERSLVHIKKEKPSVWKKFDVHELDKDFLFAIKETREQVELITALATEQEALKDLENMQKDLLTIEKKYKKNSPATFLLGPLGTASIVLKEQKLEKELLAIVNKVTTLLQGIAHSGQTDPEALQNLQVSTYSPDSESGKTVENKPVKPVILIEHGIIHNKKLLENMC